MAASRDDSLHRRIAPRFCSFARFSRPVPGVKRGSHTLAVALGIDVCTAVQQRQNARYVAGAALLGQRERRAVLDRSAFISKLLAARSTAAAELCCAAVTLPLTNVPALSSPRTVGQHCAGSSSSSFDG